jgi:choline dehydrogenase-like flavoprotein
MENTNETEVCIIGAGAAGGILALELAQRGIKVVVLESGPRHDLSRRFEYMERFLRGENPWQSPVAELDRHTTGGSVPYRLEWNRARGVGGSTLHWEGYTLRFHTDDFRLRSLYGIGEDWPISYDGLETYYSRAEKALGVAGIADDPWASPRSAPFPLPAFAHSYSDGFFAKACDRLEIAFNHLPQARNSIPYGNRSECRACGTCHVCPTGAKATIELTHIPQAEATGNAQVITDVTALRLQTENTRRVSSVIYAGHDKRQHRISAETFVLAAGAVETARILLLSASRDFPDGLANRSGLVGKYFMSHPIMDVTGRVKDKVYPYRIGFSTAMSRQFSVERNRASDGAFFLEFLNSAGPTPDRIALSSGKSGEALRKYVEEEFGHTLGIRIYCEQLPDPRNSITLNSAVRDYFGNPVPHITYSVGDYERKVLKEAQGVAASILQALGASDIRPGRMRFAAHQIGTHRMGTHPHTSVVDGNLQAHDIDNFYLIGSGCFPTATCSHPTLTIAALAIKLAEHILSSQRPKQHSRTIS